MDLEAAGSSVSLSRRARNALLRGRHGARGGTTLAQRARNLVVIACAYSRDEFAQESGIGPATLDEVTTWLAGMGRAFREAEGGRHGG